MKELATKADWSRSLAEILQEADRTAVVEHLVDGLRDGIAAELFQDGLEQAEEVLAKNVISLFEEFCELDDGENDEPFEVQVFWEKTLARLRENFSPQRLANAREVEENMGHLQGFLEGSSCDSFADQSCDSLDPEVMSTLIGMGLGALVGFGLRRSLLAGVGGALAGGFLGILASDALEE